MNSVKMPSLFLGTSPVRGLQSSSVGRRNVRLKKVTARKLYARRFPRKIATILQELFVRNYAGPPHSATVRSFPTPSLKHSRSRTVTLSPRRSVNFKPEADQGKQRGSATPRTVTQSQGRSVTLSGPRNSSLTASRWSDLGVSTRPRNPAPLNSSRIVTRKKWSLRRRSATRSLVTNNFRANLYFNLALPYEIYFTTVLKKK